MHACVCSEQRLFGNIGRTLRPWLTTLLPPDAAARCSGHSTVLLTRVPSMRTIHVDTFACKASLVDTLLASSHLPWFLDGRGAVRVGHTWVIDGGIWWWFRRSQVRCGAVRAHHIGCMHACMRKGGGFGGACGSSQGQAWGWPRQGPPWRPHARCPLPFNPGIVHI